MMEKLLQKLSFEGLDIEFSVSVMNSMLMVIQYIRKSYNIADCVIDFLYNFDVGTPIKRPTVVTIE